MLQLARYVGPLPTAPPTLFRKLRGWVSGPRPSGAGTSLAACRLIRTLTFPLSVCRIAAANLPVTAAGLAPDVKFSCGKAQLHFTV